MVIMELNLAQDLSSVDHEPLFLVFLDIRKLYSTMYKVDSFGPLRAMARGLTSVNPWQHFGSIIKLCLNINYTIDRLCWVGYLGNDAGQPCLTDTLQRCLRQWHSDVAGLDGKTSAGGHLWGGIVCQSLPWSFYSDDRMVGSIDSD